MRSGFSRMDKKVSGVMIDTTLAAQEKEAREESRERLRNDIHEITVEDAAEEKKESVKVAPKQIILLILIKYRYIPPGRRSGRRKGKLRVSCIPSKNLPFRILWHRPTKMRMYSAI